MTKITISSDLVRLPWQHRVHDDNFKHVFLYTSMLSFNCEENINIIKIFDFSQNLRPKMGLIDPRQELKDGVFEFLVAFVSNASFPLQ